MTDERWKNLIESLEDKKSIESRVVENIEGKPGTVERVIAKTPVGRVRLSRSTEPKRLSQKALYSKRGGSTVSVQALYDETDNIHVFMVEIYSPEKNDWVRIDPQNFIS